MSSFTDILKSLRPTRTNRFRVILLCMAAATTFWFLNAMNKQHTTTLNYPVQFIYDKERYVEVDELPTQVTINVNGMGWNLLRNNLGIKTSPLLIPLDNPVETRSISAVSIPSLISDQISEFQLNYVLTDTLNINLDERSERVFKLIVDSTDVSLDDGYRITSPLRVEPDSVILYGPKKLLEAMGDTIVISPGENDINENFSQNISVPVPEKVSSADPPIVAVEFTIEEYVNEDLSIPLRLIRPDGSDSVSSSKTVRVKYAVARSRADMIGPDNFTVVADMASPGEDSTVVPRLVSYPLGLMDLSYDSTAISLKVNE